MTRTSLKVIAATAFCLLLIGTARGLHEALNPDEPEYELDCQHRRDDLFPGEDHVLRLALVQMAVAAHTEAVLDAVEIPLRRGRDFTADIGCQTPREPSESSRFGSGTGIAGLGDQRRSSARARRLPEGFAGISLDLQLEGTYHGTHEGLHLLVFEDFDGTGYRFGLGYSGGGSCNLSVHCAAMSEDVPIARVYPDQGLAFFALVTSEGSEHVARPGCLDAWRSAFEGLRHLEPVPDRAAVERAVEALQPAGEHEEYHANDFLAYGPLLDLLGAALVLRDHDSAAVAREELTEDPDLLDRIREAGLPWPENHLSESFLRQVGQSWLDLVAGWTIDLARLPSFQYFPAIGIRILDLTDDPAVASASVDRMESLLRHTGVKAYVMGVDSLGRTDAVQEQFARLRGMVVGTLPAPWSLVLRSPIWLLVYCLLAPLAALLVVSVPSRTTIRSHAVSRPLLVLLAIGSFLTLGGFAMKVLIVPVWWVLAGRWLQVRGRHGFLERGLIWLALTLATVDALLAVQWFVSSPPIDVAAGFGVTFCWILVGLWVVADGRWRRPVPLQAFLAFLLLLDLLVAFGAENPIQLLGFWGLVVALLCLGGFLVSGRETRGDAVPG